MNRRLRCASPPARSGAPRCPRPRGSFSRTRSRLALCPECPSRSFSPGPQRLAPSVRYSWRPPITHNPPGSTACPMRSGHTAGYPLEFKRLDRPAERRQRQAQACSRPAELPRLGHGRKRVQKLRIHTAFSNGKAACKISNGLTPCRPEQSEPSRLLESGFWGLYPLTG